MKREERSDDDDDVSDDDRPAKRVRGKESDVADSTDAAAEPAAKKENNKEQLTEQAKKQFDERKAQPQFRAVHHPERVAAALLAQRERVHAALPGFLADLKSGALLGPNLKDAGLLAALPGAELAAGDEPAAPPSGAPPASAHLLKFEPLPSAAVAYARGILIAAAAGESSGMGPDGDERDAKGGKTSALVSLLLAEPIAEKTRMWAAYEGRSEVRASTPLHLTRPRTPTASDCV